MLDPLFPGLSPLLRSASLSARFLRAPSLFLSPLPSFLRRVPLLAASRLLSLRLPRLVALPLAFVLPRSSRGSPAPLLRFSYFTILPLFGAPVCSLFLSLVSRRSRMLSFRLSRAFLLVSPAALPPLALPGVPPASLTALTSFSLLGHLAGVVRSVSPSALPLAFVLSRSSRGAPVCFRFAPRPGFPVFSLGLDGQMRAARQVAHMPLYYHDFPPRARGIFHSLPPSFLLVLLIAIIIFCRFTFLVKYPTIQTQQQDT